MSGKATLMIFGITLYVLVAGAFLLFFLGLLCMYFGMPLELNCPIFRFTGFPKEKAWQRWGR